jgi:plastocyanin
MMSILSVFLIMITFSFNAVSAANTVNFVGGESTPHQITIDEYMFVPSELTVSAGTKVTWINHDQVPHTIVDSAIPKLFRSSALDTNDSYSFTFIKPGNYRYFCTLHPQMIGTITVTAAQ